MPLDIDRIRADTPGVQSGLHLGAAGSALAPRPVLAAMQDHLALEAEIGGYEAHARRAETLDGVYDRVAELIGAQRREIALVENATVGWCQAFYALPFKPGQRILTSEAEYAANYVAFLQRAKRDGVTVEVVPNDASGRLDPAALEAMIDERVALIAITWIPTNCGLVNPAAAVGKIARARGIPYLLDACQAVGQMPVDVGDLNCDFLSATGRKFLRGPRGTGFLYVREAWLETLEPAMIDHFAAPWVAKDRYDLRPDARRFETWENSYVLRAGLGAAASYAQEIGLEAIQERVWGLADSLRQRLRKLPGARLYDLGEPACAIVGFTLEGVTPGALVAALRKKSIFIGASDPESTRLDSEARRLPVLLRAAPHYYNTEEELDRFVTALKAA
ncbi:MAG TPA: aminotransferase class V-fold PLP-dependent enzyme, partial [Kiloniellaceae bacterium]|nr:aminotransferase class V-fold PLP-dependent enzyme [Kiloniellaceae bacterium]